MARRVQLNPEEQNRLFQEAKQDPGQDVDSGDESAEDNGVVQRGIPGEEPKELDSGMGQ